jgi:class 3 adenylate cyclase
VVARERARDAQSRAFADLASRASLFDAANDAGLRDLTRIVARTLSARAAALWAVTSDGKALVLKDRRDREHDGHTSEVELAVAELGAFMPTLAAGTTLAIADVANDPRTRELHQHFLQAMGSRAVVVAPILSSDHVLGVVWAEDARADGADVFLQAIANMLAIRFAAATVEQTRAAVASTELGGGRMIRRVAGGPPADDVAMRRASLSDAGERRLRTRAARVEVSQLAAQIFPRATIMVMRFTDAIAIAAPEAVNARVAALDRLARAMQEIAAARAIDYVKILGDSMMAAEGFDDSDAEAAAVAVAEAAIEIQARAARLFTDLGRRLEFRIGIDTGQAIGSPIGDDAHAYNLWGEAVRMATAMADTGVPGGIEVTESTYRLLRERYLFRVRGTFYLGAAGEMSSYLLTGRV